MTGFIYAMTAGTAVKIGYSWHPRERSLAIKRDVPAATLIGVMPGTHDQEREFHRTHSDLSIAGEWYPLTGVILDFICGMSPAIPDRPGLASFKSWRKAKRLTLQQAALLLGCQASLLSRWETGRSRVTDTKVVMVERVTGIPREVLRPDIFQPVEARP